MKDLSSSDLLALLERGDRLHPLDRGLLVLAAALPGTTYASLADWPLGRRNQALVRVRCACFGARLEGWTACAACGEKLELDLNTRELDGRSPELEGEVEGHGTPASVVVGGRKFRVPTSRDLALALSAGNARLGALRVAESCCLEGGAAEWLEGELEEIGETMAEADPMAEILLEMRCPECGHEGASTLDILAFVWAEIEARVKRLLAEVHDLATAYGWTEGEILALSERRRSSYLAMVRE